MEQTIKNLTMVLISVENELKNQNHRESKTLMNTYRTILQRFTSIPTYKDTLDEYEESLTKHKNKLLSLHKDVEKYIENILPSRDFKCVDVLAEVSVRLESSAQTIEQMINRRSKVRREQFNRLIDKN